jgi:hypothetical protein
MVVWERRSKCLYLRGKVLEIAAKPAKRSIAQVIL